MNTWKVYCYTEENGKKYIGITKRTLLERSGGKTGCDYNPKYHFGKAIKKYGFDFFTVEILEENLSFEEANEKEKYYIALYDTYRNGYNETQGGDGCQKFDWDKIVQLWNEGKTPGEISRILSCSYSTVSDALTQNKIDGMDRIKVSAGQYHIKEVYQFDKNGVLLNNYKSAAEAEKQTGIAHSNIIACLKGRRNTAGGFIWRSTLDFSKIDEENGNGYKKVYQYSEDKKLIKVYNNAEEAAREMGCNKETIRRACRCERKSNGYLWSYRRLDV